MTKGKSAGNSDGEYEIGYGKPPLGTRFQRGRSGNPRGRPRRPRSFDDEFWKMLGQPVTVAEGGRKKRVTTLDAALMRMREKALKGDPRTLDLLLRYSARASIGERPGDRSEIETVGDRELIEAYINEMRRNDQSGPAMARTPPRLINLVGVTVITSP